MGGEGCADHSQRDMQPADTSILESQDRRLERDLISLLFHGDDPIGLRGVLSARQCFACRGAGGKQVAGREHPAQSPREAVGVGVTQPRPSQGHSGCWCLPLSLSQASRPMCLPRR